MEDRRWYSYRYAYRAIIHDCVADLTIQFFCLGVGFLLFIISSLFYYKRQQARRRMVQQVLATAHPYNPGPGYYPNYYGQQSYGGYGQPQQFSPPGGYGGNAYPPPPNNFGDSKGNPTGGYVPVSSVWTSCTSLLSDQ